MAVINPPFALQNAGATHTAAGDRLMLSGLITGTATGLNSRGGVSASAGSEFLTTQTGSPSMQVVVGSGICYVPGSESSTQGVYACINDANVNLTIGAAHGTLPRQDSIIARVYDSQYSGASNTWALEVLPGTPAASPVPAGLPANSLRLWVVSVGAAVTSITNANIADVRTWAAAIGGIVPVRGSSDRDNIGGHPTEGVVFAYRLDTGVLEAKQNGIWYPKSPQTKLVSNQVASPPFTTLATYVDFLSGSWAPITFTAPPSGKFTVSISAAISNTNTASSTIWAAYRISGGLVVGASESNGLSAAGGRVYASRSTLWTGATPGASVTVTPQWNISSGSAGTCVFTGGQLVVTLEP